MNTARPRHIGRNMLTVALSHAILEDQADYRLAQPGVAEKYPPSYPAHLCDPQAFQAERLHAYQRGTLAAIANSLGVPPHLLMPEGAGRAVTIDAGGA